MKTYKKGNAVVNTKCPYYRASGEKYIECEGVVCDSKNRSIFSTAKQKREYQERHCFKYKSQCPIAESIEKKYGSQESTG